MKTIHFEGIDGSGKTTALKFFIEQLKSHGRRVLETREVGNPHIPICVELRKMVLDPGANLDGKSMEFIFAAMAIENQKFYDSVEDQYDYIVSDRGLLSHLAYTDHNVDFGFTQEFYQNVVMEYIRKPDVVVFLSIDPEVALKRRGIRNGFVDAIEAKGPGFQAKVYQSFLEYLPLIDSVIEVNANLSLEEVQTNLTRIAANLEKIINFNNSIKYKE